MIVRKLKTKEYKKCNNKFIKKVQRNPLGSRLRVDIKDKRVDIKDNKKEYILKIQTENKNKPIVPQELKADRNKHGYLHTIITYNKISLFLLKLLKWQEVA